jgi:hypothetical protein
MIGKKVNKRVSGRDGCKGWGWNEGGRIERDGRRGRGRRMRMEGGEKRGMKNERWG